MQNTSQEDEFTFLLGLCNGTLENVLNLSKKCDRIDVIFDLYLQQSIKQDERNRQSKADPIEVRIFHFEQQLPENKMRLQPVQYQSS